jgi:hypothetical protein
MARLSYIATRKAGVEQYRFAGLAQTFRMSPVGDGSWDVGVLRYPDRKGALADIMASASYLLERQQRRHY